MQFSYHCAIPMSYIFHIVEENSVRVYFVDPYIRFISPFAVNYFVKAASRDQKFFESSAVDFPHSVMLINIFEGYAHQFS